MLINVKLLEDLIFIVEDLFKENAQKIYISLIKALQCKHIYSMLPQRHQMSVCFLRTVVSFILNNQNKKKPKERSAFYAEEKSSTKELFHYIIFYCPSSNTVINWSFNIEQLYTKFHTFWLWCQKNVRPIGFIRDNTRNLRIFMNEGNSTKLMFALMYDLTNINSNNYS